MKNKSNGKLRGILVTMDFEQHHVKQFNPEDVVAPVVNETTTARCLMIISLISKCFIWVIETKGTFLKHEFENQEEV